MTLEERIKRIEDHLGLTERDKRKASLAAEKQMCMSYGMTASKAKELHGCG